MTRDGVASATGADMGAQQRTGSNGSGVHVNQPGRAGSGGMCPAPVECRPDRSDAHRFGAIPPADTARGGTPTGTRSSPRSGAPGAAPATIHSRPQGHGEVARIHPRHRPEPALPHLLFRPDKPRRQRERGLGDRRLAGVRSGWLWDTFAMGAVGYTSQPLCARRQGRDHTARARPGRDHRARPGLWPAPLPGLCTADGLPADGRRRVREPPRQPNAPEHLRRRDSEGRGRLRRLQRGLPVGHRPGTRTSSFRCPSRPEAMVPARVWS